MVRRCRPEARRRFDRSAARRSGRVRGRRPQARDRGRRFRQPRPADDDHGERIYQVAASDDKACVAICLGVAKAILEGSVELDRPTYLYFSVFEEVGHGTSAGIPEDVTEVIAVDMAAVGPARLRMSAPSRSAPRTAAARTTTGSRASLSISLTGWYRAPDRHLSVLWIGRESGVRAGYDIRARTGRSRCRCLAFLRAVASGFAPGDRTTSHAWLSEP